PSTWPRSVRSDEDDAPGNTLSAGSSKSSETSTLAGLWATAAAGRIIRAPLTITAATTAHATMHRRVDPVVMAPSVLAVPPARACSIGCCNDLLRSAPNDGSNDALLTALNEQTRQIRLPHCHTPTNACAAIGATGTSAPRT